MKKCTFITGIILSMSLLFVHPNTAFGFDSLFDLDTFWDTGVSPRSIAASDVNGDGDIDLAIANLGSDNVSILLGNGDGTFASAVNYDVGDNPRSIVAADLDGDGDIDLAATNFYSDNVSILLGNGDGTFVTAVNYVTGITPFSVTAADFNEDGNIDLAVANSGSDNISLLSGNGDGTFASAVNYDVGEHPRAVVAADFDGNGDIDLATANGDTYDVSILLGNGDGTFAQPVSYVAGHGPYGLTAADVDGDGDSDLAVTNGSSDNLSVLLGNGDGTFTSAVNYATGDGPCSVASADLDGDGDSELVVANLFSDNLSVLFGNGDGTFASAVSYVAGDQPCSVVPVDVDGDGDSDLAVANGLSDNISIHINLSPVIISTKDVPYDQGGYVTLNWKASGGDTDSKHAITHYSVWRAVDSVSITSSELKVLSSAALYDIEKDFNEPVYRIENSLSGDYYWEWVGNQNAYCFEGYSYTVPTRYDSIQNNSGMHYFQILAHTSDQSVFLTSPPDSGYSVDNLSPCVPICFNGFYENPPDLLTLHWHPNVEQDLSFYNIYRGEGADFVPSEDNLIAITQDTIITSLPYYPVDPWYIKLSAVDVHGNESGFALLPPEQVPVSTLITSSQARWKDDAVEVRWEIVDSNLELDYHVSRRNEENINFHDFPCEIMEDTKGFFFRDEKTELGGKYTYKIVIMEDDKKVGFFESSITTPDVEFTLKQNYPNPFNPSTTIQYSIPKKSHVILDIFDVSGCKIKRLIDSSHDNGTYEVTWFGRNDNGIEVSSGVYFYKLTANEKNIVKKMILMK